MLGRLEPRVSHQHFGNSSQVDCNAAGDRRDVVVDSVRALGLQARDGGLEEESEGSNIVMAGESERGGGVVFGWDGWGVRLATAQADAPQADSATSIPSHRLGSV